MNMYWLCKAIRNIFNIYLLILFHIFSYRKQKEIEKENEKLSEWLDKRNKRKTTNLHI